MIINYFRRRSRCGFFPINFLVDSGVKLHELFGENFLHFQVFFVVVGALFQHAYFLLESAP